MTFLLTLVLCFFPPSPSEVDALRRTAPDYLTTESAEINLIAVQAAGVTHAVRVELLLSVAWHESRYEYWHRTPEPGGRESCGVMSPVPKKKCTPADLTVIGGYDAGAGHLAEWRLRYPRDFLLAYAGGGGLVRACRRGPFLVRGRDLCRVKGEFLWRARMIGGVL